MSVNGPPQFGKQAWPGLAWPGLAWPGLARVHTGGGNQTKPPLAEKLEQQRGKLAALGVLVGRD